MVTGSRQWTSRVIKIIGRPGPRHINEVRDDSPAFPLLVGRSDLCDLWAVSSLWPSVFISVPQWFAGGTVERHRLFLDASGFNRTRSLL